LRSINAVNPLTPPWPPQRRAWLPRINSTRACHSGPLNSARCLPTRSWVQAYALLRAARPRARPEGSHKALAVAAYLSGHYWWPDDLGRAIDLAMGKQNGAGNDPRNVIRERHTGLEPLGLVTLYKQRNGRRETWSCKLTATGEAVVAEAAARRPAPVAAVRGVISPVDFTVSVGGPIRAKPSAEVQPVLKTRVDRSDHKQRLDLCRKTATALINMIGQGASTFAMPIVSI
jgi:hypothetical protein